MTADFEPEKIDLAREEDFRLGTILVRPSSRQIESGVASETLEPRIMQVLVALARRRGQVISRDELTLTCWEGRVVGDDAINRCISKIRKLADLSGAFTLETIPRVGYRLWEKGVAGPTEAGQAAAQPANIPEPPKALGRPAWQRPPVLAAAAFLVIALGAVAIYFGVRGERTNEVSPPQLTVAVLKFNAPPGDAEMDRFAEAVSRALGAELIGAGVTLVSPAQSLELTGARKADAARLLKAQLLVDGDVSRDGGQARLSVRVDHAKRGVSVWALTTTVDPADVASLAKRLATPLRRTASWRPVLRMLDSDDPKAAQKAATQLRIIQLSDEYGEDIQTLEAARQFILNNPDDSLACRTLAVEGMDGLVLLAPADRPPVLKAVREATIRATSIDPKSGEEWATHVAGPAWDWAGRISGFEQAFNGRYLAQARLRTGAIAQAGKAIELGRAEDSNGKSVIYVSAQAALAAGDKSEGDRYLADGMLFWPSNPIFPELRFQSEAWLGSAEAAQDLLAKPGVWRVREAHRDLLTKFLAAKATPDARRVTALEETCASQVTVRNDAAMTYCLSALSVLGRTAAAFRIAAVLYPDIRPKPGEDPDARWLAAPAPSWDPILLFMPWTANLRADPDIIPVFERLGLMDYWRASGQRPDFCDTEPKAANVCAKMKAM